MLSEVLPPDIAPVRLISKLQMASHLANDARRQNAGQEGERWKRQKGAEMAESMNKLKNELEMDVWISLGIYSELHPVKENSDLPLPASHRLSAD